MRVVFALTLAGGLGLLGLAMWPGLLERTFFSFAPGCLTLPVLALGICTVLFIGVVELARRPTPPRHRPWGWAVATSAVALGTAVMLWDHTPQRVAFVGCGCATGLQPLVPTAPLDESEGPAVGLYTVDQYAADSRGGVFFRTATGPDGIGPDQFSYGFAFRPNAIGTPFGNSSYSLHHLFGDWYSFAASND